MVRVFQHIDIKKQIQRMFASGGQSQIAADRCKALLFDLKYSDNPLEAIKRYPTTHHGETRIKHCVKSVVSGYKSKIFN
jgi:hypothetical protein